MNSSIGSEIQMKIPNVSVVASINFTRQFALIIEKKDSLNFKNNNGYILAIKSHFKDLPNSLLTLMWISVCANKCTFHFDMAF